MSLLDRGNSAYHHRDLKKKSDSSKKLKQYMALYKTLYALNIFSRGEMLGVPP